VPNATTGVNAVLRNIVWNEGDEILYFRYKLLIHLSFPHLYYSSNFSTWV